MGGKAEGIVGGVIAAEGIGDGGIEDAGCVGQEVTGGEGAEGSCGVAGEMEGQSSEVNFLQGLGGVEVLDVGDDLEIFTIEGEVVSGEGIGVVVCDSCVDW